MQADAITFSTTIAVATTISASLRYWPGDISIAGSVRELAERIEHAIANRIKRISVEEQRSARAEVNRLQRENFQFPGNARQTEHHLLHMDLTLTPADAAKIGEGLIKRSREGRAAMRLTLQAIEETVVQERTLDYAAIALENAGLLEGGWNLHAEFGLSPSTLAFHMGLSVEVRRPRQ